VLRAIEHGEVEGVALRIDARLGAGFGRRAEARRFDVRAAGEHHAGENRFGRRDLAGRRGRHEDDSEGSPPARAHIASNRVTSTAGRRSG